jgi:two-component system sensor histidine kinase CpxA
LSTDAAAAGGDLDRIALEADRLDRLIGQSLTLARLETGVEAGPTEAFDLTTLVEQVAADGDYEARASGRQVIVTASDPCAMTGSADLVRSAIENVVRNAIRYTPAGSAVEVQLRRHAAAGSAEARLHVRDRGPGIPDAWLEVVFLPFRRGRAHDGSGSGLGLAIADRVVRMHNGRITAANAEGGGLDVEIRLPVRP